LTHLPIKSFIPISVGAFDQRVEVAGHIPNIAMPPTAPLSSAFIETSPRRMTSSLPIRRGIQQNRKIQSTEDHEHDHESEEEVGLGPSTSHFLTRTTDRSQLESQQAGTSSSHAN
jgi:hypothetical protein